MATLKCEGTVDPIRSRIMRSVKSKDTGPELRLRKALFAKGYRYFVNCKTLPGKPDIVFPRLKVVIFVNGCFWHRHGCKKSSMPKTRTEFWDDKFHKNVERDLKNYDELKKDGWTVIVVWECELASGLEKKTAEIASCLDLRSSATKSPRNSDQR